MPKLTPACRDALRTEFLSRVQGTYVKGEVLTNNLRKGPGMCARYVNFLEDNYIRTENYPLLDKERIKFSSLYEMLEYVSDKPLTTWQKNNIRRWEESRRKLCPSVLLVVDPVQEETDETAELRKQVAEMKERIKEQEEKYMSRLNELVEAQRKLKRIQLVATTTYGKEDK